MSFCLLTLLQQQTDCATQCLADTPQTLLPCVKQVIDQTRQRVIQGESVPAGEKLVRMFDPHTAIIRKGMAGKATELGHLFWMAEAEGGIITQARVLSGTSGDASQSVPSLAQQSVQSGRRIWSQATAN